MRIIFLSLLQLILSTICFGGDVFAQNEVNIELTCSECTNDPKLLREFKYFLVTNPKINIGELGNKRASNGKISMNLGYGSKLVRFNNSIGDKFILETQSISINAEQVDYNINFKYQEASQKEFSIKIDDVLGNKLNEKCKIIFTNGEEITYSRYGGIENISFYENQIDIKELEYLGITINLKEGATKINTTDGTISITISPSISSFIDKAAVRTLTLFKNSFEKRATNTYLVDRLELLNELEKYSLPKATVQVQSIWKNGNSSPVRTLYLSTYFNKLMLIENFRWNYDILSLEDDTSIYTKKLLITQYYRKGKYADITKKIIYIDRNLFRSLNVESVPERID